MWGKDDASDLFAVFDGTRQMRDGAKKVRDAIGRIRDRHRRDATTPAILRGQHADADAVHVAVEADEIERDAEVIHRMYEGGAS